MSLLKTAALAIALSTAGAGVCAPAIAQAEIVQTDAGGPFVQKSKTLKGSYKIVTRGEKTFVVFSDDFKAKNGPDLKVFLSPQSLDTVTGKTATEGALNIGELKRNKGTQEYELPAGVSLDSYQSILVHCEAYSVLWGGGAL